MLSPSSAKVGTRTTATTTQTHGLLLAELVEQWHILRQLHGQSLVGLDGLDHLAPAIGLHGPLQALAPARVAFLELLHPFLRLAMPNWPHLGLTTKAKQPPERLLNNGFSYYYTLERHSSPSLSSLSSIAIYHHNQRLPTFPPFRHLRLHMAAGLTRLVKCRRTRNQRARSSCLRSSVSGSTCSRKSTR